MFLIKTFTMTHMIISEMVQIKTLNYHVFLNHYPDMSCLYQEYLRASSNHLASLAKWLSVRLRTKWLWVRKGFDTLNHQIRRLLRARSSLTFRQL